MSSMPKRKCFATCICVISDQKLAVNFTVKRQKEGMLKKTVQKSKTLTFLFVIYSLV